MGGVVLFFPQTGASSCSPTVWTKARTLCCSSAQSPLPSRCRTGCLGADPCACWRLCSWGSPAATPSTWNTTAGLNSTFKQHWHAARAPFMIPTCRSSSSCPAPSAGAASPGWSYRPGAGVLQVGTEERNSYHTHVFIARAVVHSTVRTSSVPQHHLFVVHQPAEAGELHVVPRRGLDRDVAAVPVIVHPVLLLLQLHQHDVPQVLVHPHIIGVHLPDRNVSSVDSQFSSGKNNFIYIFLYIYITSILLSFQGFIMGLFTVISQNCLEFILFLWLFIVLSIKHSFKLFCMNELRS